MPQPTFLTITEQVAEHLRGELQRGRWSGTIPGLPTLAAALGVNRKTVEAALRLLEEEGLLVGQGPGRARRIELPEGAAPPALRVAVLLPETRDRGEDFIIELRYLLEEAGHTPFFPDKTLLDLGMDAKRVARFAKRTEADAWVVGAGSSEILEWFSDQDIPAFALFGRRAGLPIAAAGPDKAPVFATATRHLIGLGHRRITLLCRGLRRLPEPGQSERAFLDALQAADIQTGEFNLPDWEQSKEGFGDLLNSLFGSTPPTALILDEPFLFNAALHFLARRRLRVPEDVSLICTDADPGFAWCEPSVAHMRWDYRPVLRRVVRWAANVSHGKRDLRQTLTRAEFVDGGTVGPVGGDDHGPGI